ncbi:MAG: tetratricopeptide repeat protein [Geobacteraceae bacterium]|nr:tetratricopeptide repeat protein [Geobacteraceae bacterium]
MQSSTESFWSEIKMYEERLKSDPSSYCFAPLAEVYLRAGLLDDALSVSRTGVSKHPGYADGQMALARVCHQKGLVDECRRALEAVATAVPGHAEAQRLLARLYKESGNEQAALQALQTLLDFHPDDMSARIELEALQQKVAAFSDDDLELIELTEADIYEEPEDVGELVERIKPVARTVEDPWSGINAVTPEEVPSPTALEAVWSVPEQQLAAVVEATDGHDPLNTSTLAELYVSQGFSDKAIEIYRRIVAVDPGNQEAASRLKELEQAEVAAESGQAAAVAAELSSVSPNLPVEGVADQQAAVTVLEGWLENIRRLRVCR